MQAATLDVVVAEYPVEQEAEQVLENLLDASIDGAFELRAAVTMRKDSCNELHIEDRNPSVLLGGLTDSVAGVVAWPAGLNAHARPELEDLPARLQDGGFLDELRSLGRRLPAGCSAIVLVINHGALSGLKAVLTERDCFRRSLDKQASALAP